MFLFITPTVFKANMSETYLRQLCVENLMSPIYECIEKNSSCLTQFKLEACQHFHILPLNAFPLWGVEGGSQTITCFCFRSSFPHKISKAVHPFHLCLTLKLDIRVSVLGSWGPKLYSLWLSGGAVFITSASCRVVFYARPSVPRSCTFLRNNSIHCRKGKTS